MTRNYVLPCVAGEQIVKFTGQFYRTRMRQRISHDCAKSVQGKHLVVVRYRQPGQDVPTLSPLPLLCPPAPAEWYLYLYRQSNKSPAGQFAIVVIVIRGNIHHSGLRTAVALSTASLVSLTKPSV